MPIGLANRLKQPPRWLPRLDGARWVELLLCAILAIQIVRLFWTLVTPVGVFGTWNPRQPIIPGVVERQALLTGFDPFFRTAQATGNANVTSLSLRLYGIRLNEGSGGGSAIIAGPDGVQSSFAVGDEIVPGVKLKAVAFDSVTIDRGGVAESLYLDQSQPAPSVNADRDGGAGAPPPPSADGSRPVGAAAIQSDIAFAPRSQGNRITGISVGPKGSGAGFQAAGFQNGDVVTQVNGQPVASAADLQTLQGQIAPGARLSLIVERGGTTIPIALILGGQ